MTALVTTLVLSMLPVFNWVASADGTAHNLQHEVEHAGEEVSVHVLERFRTFELVLRGVRGFVEGSDTVTAIEFSAFIRALQLSQTADGLLGVTYIPWIAAEQVDAFLAEAGPRYGVWDLVIDRDEGQDAYAPILFIESPNGNAYGPRGFDIFRVPQTRNAALQARDTGQTVLSDRVPLRLIGGDSQDAAMVMYVPIYGQPASDVEARRRHFIGWASARFRVSDVVHSPDLLVHSGLHIQLFEGDSPADDRFLAGRLNEHDLPLNGADIDPRYRAQGVIEFGGNRLNYTIAPTTEFIATHADVSHHGFAALGVLLSVLAGAIVWLLMTGRDRADRAARIMTRELRRLSADMDGTLNAIPDLLFEVDRQGRYVALRTRTEQGLLVPRHELVGKTVHEVLPEPAAQVCLEAFEEAAVSGFSFGRQIELVIDDAPRWFELSVAPKQADDGGELHFVMLSRDITDRVLALRQLEQSERALREAQRVAAVGHFWVDTDTRLWRGSASVGELLGLPGESTMPLEQVVALIDPRFRDRFMAACLCAEGDPQPTLEFSLARADDGALRWMLLCSRQDAGPRSPGGSRFFTLQDVTRRHESEAQLKLLEKAVASLNDMILVTEAEPVDKPGPRIVFVNDAFVRKTGYERAEVLGKSPRILQGRATSRQELDRIRQALLAWQPVRAEIVNYTKDKQPYWVELVIQPMADEEGWFTHWVSVERDVTERRLAEDKVHQLAYYDGLTQLPNRALFMETVAAMLSEPAPRPALGAALLVDLDNFKVVNDNWGHHRGDRLLIEIAQRIQAELEPQDLLARLGGDEFMVLLQDAGADLETASRRVHALSERLLAAIARPLRIDEGEHFTSASIGGVLFGDGPLSVEELLSRVDSAMYSAKSSGKNAFRFFDSRLKAQVAEQAMLERDLRLSIDRQELHLLYQPQVDAHGRVVGAEALCRWHHGTQGSIPPSLFIPLAETSGFIQAMGLWILESACAFLATWSHDRLTQDLSLSVNVSARQFLHPDFLQQVERTLAKTGASPHQLKLELTESVFAGDIDDIVQKMASLHALGIRFSLDDFGTGYSSLSYLKSLPLDQLKIDQSFVKDVLRSSSDQAIVRTVIALGQSLGLRVIAEGVETPEQQEFLHRGGCEFYQGYLYGRPMREQELLDLVLAGDPSLGG